MMEWIDELRHIWKAQGLLSAIPGASEESVLEFEKKFGVQLPMAVRRYFQGINGMSTKIVSDTDDDGYRFLPLSEVMSTEGLSSSLGWNIGSLRKAFIFVDYFQWSNAFAFDVSAESEGAVYLLGYPTPSLVSPSFVEFILRYIARDPSLYKPMGANYPG